MSHVPPELVHDILSRVPVESLLRFQCVCKAWRSDINDLVFIKSHLHRQNDGGRLILRNTHGTRLYTLSLNSLYDHECHTKLIEATPLKTVIRHDVTRLSVTPMAQCNGLVLISRRIYNVWALWNPFTRECHQMPSYGTIARNQGGGLICVGLGYDLVTDDYKVVRIGDYYYDRITRRTIGETLVYSLKSNSWRTLMDCPCVTPYREVPGVFLNGALHWTAMMAMGQGEGVVILVFNLGTEDYRILPVPSIMSGPDNYQRADLAVLDGCLIMSYISSVYRLNDYGGENTWTKLFSFCGTGLKNIRPIAHLKSKGQILLQRFPCRSVEEYFWFDIEKKSVKKVRIDGAKDLHFSQMCPASLVRINYDGGRVDCTVDSEGIVGEKRKRDISTERLELTLTTTDVQETATVVQ